jgi:hypothetical protein
MTEQLLRKPTGRPGPDLTGKKFGMLSVIMKIPEKRRGRALWQCLCECGRIHHVVGHALTSGNTVSCGCKKTTFPAALRHGQTGTRLHNIWVAMRKRCSPSCDKRQRPFYYDKGIRVCNSWSSFDVFRAWANANGYEDDLTIDRMDGNGDYEPGNCRWATMVIQNNNSAHNRMITMSGEKKTLKEWAASIGIGASGLFSRIRAGWPLEEALTLQPGAKRVTK